jgi:mRNA (guanine-N7-)-methyltransferase
MDNATVSQHYNERRDEGREGRQTSRIIRLRNFNNWVKTVLINLHTRPGCRVLDLCCGKGGDLQKWAKVKASALVSCDTAAVSISQAVERYNKMTSVTFRPTFLVGDCFDVRLTEYLEQDVAFDIVSCQFAMHYAFESEERTRQMLLNVTERLKPGGFFIGTTPDANVVVRKLRAVDGLSIGNGVFKIDMDERFKDKTFPRGQSWFGIRYNFTLDSNVEDCPEYLVHFPSLQELARDYELELILLSNFHDFYAEFSSEQYGDFRDLFRQMRVLDDSGSMSPDEWDAIYIYTAFAFKKIGASDGTPSDDLQVPRAQQWPSVQEDEIIYMHGDGSEEVE